MEERPVIPWDKDDTRYAGHPEDRRAGAGHAHLAIRKAFDLIERHPRHHATAWPPCHRRIRANLRHALRADSLGVFQVEEPGGR